MSQSLIILSIARSGQDLLCLSPVVARPIVSPDPIAQNSSTEVKLTFADIP